MAKGPQVRLRFVHVVVEQLVVDGGHWCSACLLPSGWVAWVVVRRAQDMHLQRRTWCDECGRRDSVLVED